MLAEDNYLVGALVVALVEEPARSEGRAYGVPQAGGPGHHGIANYTLLSVLERISDIGLRRPRGAAPRHIAVQFLVESVIVGFLGGLLGTAVGVILTVSVSWIRDWTPILDNRLAFGSPLLGAFIGLVAGTYPAWKASAIQPITALRGT
jgi:putative ABC transport system permease protein